LDYVHAVFENKQTGVHQYIASLAQIRWPEFPTRDTGKCKEALFS